MNGRTLLVAAFIACVSIAPLGGTPHVRASTEDLGSAIDDFVVHQFPQARAHHWVVNQTLVENEEVTVDVKAVVTVPSRTTPLEERFLLLFVKGKLAAAQFIPLDGDPECEPEQQA
ncbi:hypothetical protein YTPLAS18_27980 [Nitrospira sp.]|nr:hypothetical protein YTPLAS18_27980 [Nitrospira sp.]